MRYALCLHGMAFGKTDIGNNVDWSGAYPYFKENVLRPDVDVFCHTWGENNPEWGKLVESYSPEGVLYEKQKDFPGCPETKSIYSRWYSALSSVSLPMSNLILGNNYDGVLLARYDLVFKVKFPWDTLDPKFFWTPKWRQKPSPNSGYLDYWFYGNLKDMYEFVQMNHYLDTFFKSGVKENGHSVVEAQIKNVGLESRVQQWGEQPQEFILYRRLMGATN